MSVAEAQPVPVKADGWWSGLGPMNVLICTEVLVNKLSDLFLEQESFLACRNCPGHALACSASLPYLDLRTGPGFLTFCSLSLWLGPI